MVECGSVLVRCDDKRVVHAAMVVEHGIDRRVALHQDEADPSRIEEGHVRARNGGQMVTADNFCVKPRASRDVAHGDAEMGNGLDRNHVTLPRPIRSRNRATSFFASSSRPCTTKTLDRSSAGVATAIGASPGAPRSAISSILCPNTAARVPSIEVSRALTSGAEPSGDALGHKGKVVTSRRRRRDRPGQVARSLVLEANWVLVDSAASARRYRYQEILLSSSIPTLSYGCRSLY